MEDNNQINNADKEVRKTFWQKIVGAITQKPKFSKTQLIAMNGVLCAIILLFVLLPINIGTLQLAFIPIIAVIISAEFIGWRNGILTGLFFGIVSLCNQFIHPSLLAQAFYNPLVSIIPRMMIGLVTYLVTKGMKKFFAFCERKRVFAKLSRKATKISSEVIIYALGAASGVITNTVLVCGMILVFHFGTTFTSATTSLYVGWQWLIATITGNFLIELAICTVITPPIIIALKKVVK